MQALIKKIFQIILISVILQEFSVTAKFVNFIDQLVTKKIIIRKS